MTAEDAEIAERDIFLPFWRLSPSTVPGLPVAFVKRIEERGNQRTAKMLLIERTGSIRD